VPVSNVSEALYRVARQTSEGKFRRIGSPGDLGAYEIDHGRARAMNRPVRHLCATRSLHGVEAPGANGWRWASPESGELRIDVSRKATRIIVVFAEQMASGLDLSAYGSERSS